MTDRLSPLRRLGGRIRLRLFELGPDTRLDSPALRACPAHVRDRLVARADQLRDGCSAALAAPDRASLVADLDRVDPELLPFRYEGAAMGCALLDLLPVPGRHRWAELYALRASSWSRFLVVGRGWAYAALGRRDDLGRLLTDPAHVGQDAEGAGFHDAVFLGFPRPRLSGSPVVSAGYDTGSGRALWFLSGADPHQIADAIADVEPDRRADLWSGVGFAATLAGGAYPATYGRLSDVAGPSCLDGAREALSLLPATGPLWAGALDRCRQIVHSDPVEAAAGTASADR